MALRLDGQRFGKLLVIKLAMVKNTNSYWLCKCDCGNLKEIMGGSLKRGLSKSCGCMQKISALKHGKWGTKEYRAWNGLINRCFNKHKRSDRYGDRGITVCQEWRNSFETFYKDMGDSPSKNHSIDRINNDGNYEPGNCRWATKTEQMKNTNRNTYFEYNGKRMTICEWGLYLGGCDSLIFHRLDAGWSLERALSQPAHPYLRKKEPKP